MIPKEDDLMKRLSRFSVCLLVPVLALTFSVAGCGEKEKPKAADGGKKASGDKGAQPAPAGAPEPIVAKSTGVLKGKIEFDGEPPAAEDFTQRMKEHKDGDICLKGPTKSSKWVVDSNKGVKNVVVWLKAPANKFFQLSDEQKKWSGDQPKVDQPFCAFEPHVTVLFPSYFDGKKQIPTGQKFKVLNSADIAHNTNWSGNALVNPGKNETIKAHGDVDVPIKPAKDERTGEDLVTLRCDLHKWMDAFVYAFDHPFAAVTKEDGTYEIKGVPTGVELEVCYWHESMPRPKKETKTLKDKEDQFSAKIKP
jgi:hypothetical protein